MSDISGNPANKIEAYQPLADYLAADLADFGIKQGGVVVASDISTMIDHLKTGQVDLYFDSPYPAVTVYEEAGAHPLLRRWKKGVAEYHTVIAAGKDTGITDPSGLLGQVIAFDDLVSTSGYLLPKGHLTSLGYALAETPSASGAIAADEIGYVFAGGEENVLAWVLDGRTAGGAFKSGDFDELAPDVRDQLVVISETPAVPRHIALARPGMEEGLEMRITELLLGLHETPEGQAVLDTFERTKKFDALPEGVDGTIAMLRQVLAEE